MNTHLEQVFGKVVRAVGKPSSSGNENLLSGAVFYALGTNGQHLEGNVASGAGDILIDYTPPRLYQTLWLVVYNPNTTDALVLVKGLIAGSAKFTLVQRTVAASTHEVIPIPNFYSSYDIQKVSGPSVYWRLVGG